MNFNKKRPVFLNLLRIHMPATAILSIGHRISGVLLFLAIPLFLYLFELSLSGQAGFDQVKTFLGSGLIKIVCIVMLWGLIHHLLAGLRFLLLDIHVGMSKSMAKNSAWLIHISEIIILFFLVMVLF